MTQKLESLNPATGDVVGVHVVDEPADVDAAVARAREAAAWWGELSFDERKQVLNQWKGVLARRMGQLADLVHQETGKPHADAQLEIGLAIEHAGGSTRPIAGGTVRLDLVAALAGARLTASVIDRGAYHGPGSLMISGAALV